LLLLSIVSAVFRAELIRTVFAGGLVAGVRAVLAMSVSFVRMLSDRVLAAGASGWWPGAAWSATGPWMMVVPSLPWVRVSRRTAGRQVSRCSLRFYGVALVDGFLLWCMQTPHR